MTTQHRDRARRCERCSRVVYDVKPFGVAVDGLVGLSFELCRRCRHEVADVTWRALHDPPRPALEQQAARMRAITGAEL